MMRKLAVPIALRNVGVFDRNTMTRTRTLRAPHEDSEEYHILATLAENRARIERLHRGMDHVQHHAECADIVNELEYLKADIELSLVDIEADIEEMPSSEDILLQEAETVFA
jgi:hypothetical protein